MKAGERFRRETNELLFVSVWSQGIQAFLHEFAQLRIGDARGGFGLAASLVLGGHLTWFKGLNGRAEAARMA